MKNILIFGANGSMGNHIFDSFVKTQKFNVYGTVKFSSDDITDVSFEKSISTAFAKQNNIGSSQSHNIINVSMDNLNNLLHIDNIDIIVWAQGKNCNDNIETIDDNIFSSLLQANVMFITKTLNFLLKNNKINDNAKMVIISSIWEKYTRESKLSYSISKAALSGLIKNVSYDLGKKNILINNVLPGVVDNEMTRQTISPKELEYIMQYTHFNRLVSLDEIYKTIYFLVVENTAITGQSIVIDLGFTNIIKYK
jgi:NAD(P)-dependent dehydrogenase (short-subunit alcohol dehydrogenase family)